MEVEGERIVSVTKRSEVPKSAPGKPRVLDYGNAVIMPGLIDAYAFFTFHNLGGDLPVERLLSSFMNV